MTLYAYRYGRPEPVVYTFEITDEDGNKREVEATSRINLDDAMEKIDDYYDYEKIELISRN